MSLIYFKPTPLILPHLFWASTHFLHMGMDTSIFVHSDMFVSASLSIVSTYNGKLLVCILLLNPKRVYSEFNRVYR